MTCAAIVETAAEKLVALTRRAGAELAGLRKTRDPTLVRHLYDLHVIRAHYDAEDAASLAHAIMNADAETRARAFPAYRADPLAETLKAIHAMAADGAFAAAYANFSRDMVYDEAPEFDAAIATLAALAQHLQRRQA